MSYVSLADLKLYLDIKGSADDAMLSLLIGRAQRVVDNYCRRTFEASVDATRFFHPRDNTVGRKLRLDRDLAQVTSVINGNGTELTSEQYVLHPRNYQVDGVPIYAIELVPMLSWEWVTDADVDQIAVKGRWAYSVLPPPDIVHATVRLVGYYVEQRKAGVFDVTVFPESGVIQQPIGFPIDVTRILERYRRRA